MAKKQNVPPPRENSAELTKQCPPFVYGEVHLLEELKARHYFQKITENKARMEVIKKGPMTKASLKQAYGILDENVKLSESMLKSIDLAKKQRIARFTHESMVDHFGVVTYQ